MATPSCRRSTRGEGRRLNIHPASLVFFLGGSDLEMLTIRELLEREAPGRVHDRKLGWGARASAYSREIASCIDEQRTPVLVELEDDLGLGPAAVVVVDHHGPAAGRDTPTSLHQVFRLLGLPRDGWTSWYELVAANDRGYIPELLTIGASAEEVARVRRADRAAQGITAEEEAEGEQAVEEAEALAGGRLTVVRLKHSRLATVEDRLDPTLGGPGVTNLLVLSPDEVNFSGAGPLVLALAGQYPGGWFGGNLPDRGYWGTKDVPQDLVHFLVSLLQEVERDDG